MKKLLLLTKKYKFFFMFLILNITLLFVDPVLGRKSFSITKDNLLEMVSVIPPIFILLGLLDVWMKRETMMKYIGHDAGIKGIIIAFIMGSAAAGPLYAAFPIATILLKKGAKLSNVFIFVGAWSTTKIPMLLFESSSLGSRYMLIRLICNIIGVIVIAILLEKSISLEEQKTIYDKAREI